MKRACDTTAAPSILPSEFQARLGDLLDRALVRAENGHVVQEELRKLAIGLEDRDRRLLSRVQGVVGLVNATEPSTPLREQALDAVGTLKRECRSCGATTVPLSQD